MTNTPPEREQAFMTNEQKGEGFAYFRWLCLKWPSEPAECFRNVIYYYMWTRYER